MKPPQNKPCRIVVTHCRNGERYGADYVRDERRQPARYRSIRQASANIHHAAQRMDYLSRATYEVEIEVIATGERKRMPEGMVDAVVAHNRYDSWYSSIGQCIARGETPVV